MVYHSCPILVSDTILPEMGVVCPEMGVVSAHILKRRALTSALIAMVYCIQKWA